MAEGEEAEEGGGGGGKSRLGLIIGVLVVLALIGGGVFFFKDAIFGSDDAEDIAGGEEGTADGADAGAVGAVIHTLGKFGVNLRGSGGGRMLRMEVQVKIPMSDLAVIEEEQPLLRDSIIMLASDYTYGELEGLDGKTRLRDELQARLNSVLEGRTTIQNIYFTEFIIQ